MTLKTAATLIAVAILSACASGGNGEPDASQQLGFGVKVAQKGLWQEAHFRFTRAHEQDPDNAEILNNLAVAQEALGLFDEALETYKRALEIEPKNTQIRRNYARFAEFYTSYSRRFKPKGGDDASR